MPSSTYFCAIRTLNTNLFHKIIVKSCGATPVVCGTLRVKALMKLFQFTCQHSFEIIFQIIHYYIFMHFQSSLAAALTQTHLFCLWGGELKVVALNYTDT